MSEFTIDFVYNGFPYTGIVKPIAEGDGMKYSVKVESENQESHLEIVANNCGSDKLDWCFYCPEGEEPPKDFDKAFLQEIGEAIEKHEVSS
jgi:hypothetical protein